jgi:hypothetical protein
MTPLRIISQHGVNLSQPDAPQRIAALLDKEIPKFKGAEMSWQKQHDLQHLTGLHDLLKARLETPGFRPHQQMPLLDLLSTEMLQDLGEMLAQHLKRTPTFPAFQHRLKDIHEQITQRLKEPGFHAGGNQQEEEEKKA